MAFLLPNFEIKKNRVFALLALGDENRKKMCLYFTKLVNACFVKYVFEVNSILIIKRHSDASGMRLNIVIEGVHGSSRARMKTRVSTWEG